MRTVHLSETRNYFANPKNDKDLLSVKNWGPISLLNTDYKIATKCIAKRQEKVLPLLIGSGSNQTQ